MTDDNVVHLHALTTLDVPVDRVLDGAKHLQSVLVLGWDADGELYAAASGGDDAETLMLLERFKFKLLNGDYSA